MKFNQFNDIFFESTIFIEFQFFNNHFDIFNESGEVLSNRIEKKLSCQNRMNYSGNGKAALYRNCKNNISLLCSIPNVPGNEVLK